MNNINEIVLFLEKNKNNPLKYKIIYETFLKNVENNKLLKWSFNSTEGFGELAFTWSWKLLVDSMPNNFKFLEIGVYRGRQISQVSMLAKNINKSCSIFGVTPLSNAGDKYSGYINIDYLKDIQKHFKLLNGNINNLKIIKGYSQEEKIIKDVSRYGKYNMIFIDGSHNYNDVINDIKNYSNMLVLGGYLIMDDASLYLKDSYGKFKGHPDVGRACKELLDNNINFQQLYAVGHNRIWKLINNNM